jgi:hypothetical protein
MNIFIGFLIAVFFVWLIFSMIIWGVHISMIRNDGCAYGWATYSKFKREFNKYTWNFDYIFTDSLFNYPEGGYLHASIYRFNNKGMIMRDPVSYLLSALYIRNYIKRNYKIPNKKNVVEW